VDPLKIQIKNTKKGPLKELWFPIVAATIQRITKKIILPMLGVKPLSL